jgi:DNA polymerase III psi subunit
MLKDVDLIDKEAKLIKNVLKYLNLSKKSFLDLDPERHGYHVETLFKIIDGVSHG